MYSNADKPCSGDLSVEIKILNQFKNRVAVTSKF